MNRHSEQRRLVSHGSPRRRGAVIPLVAVFLVVFVAMAAFSIDAAYMQLVNTQLKAATDAAARAGTSALVQGKTNAQAQAAAQAMAAKNYVAGRPLSLATSDITIGQSQQQADGSWAFVAGASPSQATQINSKLFANNANGAVPLFFAPILGVSSYQPQTTSVASAFACEVTLCLDRSGSMKWDTSGTEWKYPSPYLWDSDKGNSRAPLPGSRWHALRDAVNTFTTILNTANAPPRVGVVTWSSSASTDLGLSTNMTSVYNAVNAYTSQAFQGGTDMQEGMSYGVTQLTGAGVRTYARKIMILMSDGEWNQGNNPITYASTCASNNITVHTVCFLASGTGPSALQSIASATGGSYYLATDAASLNAAFTQLAYSLPVVLTK